jgi:MYXO-CTERM domain-containing protein
MLIQGSQTMKLSRVAIATVALTSGHAFAQSQFPQSLRTNLGFAQSSYATGLLAAGGAGRMFGVHAAGGTIYATGDAGLNYSTNGGSTWNYYASDTFRYQAVDVYASGSSIYTATGFGVRFSNDGGATWNTADTSNGLQFGQVWDVWGSGSTVYAATDNGIGISVDGGNSWNMRYPTQPWGAGVNEVRHVNVRDGVIYAGSREGLCISADGGATWTIRQLGLNSNSHGVFATADAIYAGAGDGLRKSTDGGSTWTLTGATAGVVGDQSVYNVFVVGNTIYGTYGSQGRSGSFISTNGGTTWTRYSESGYRFFADESNAYLAGSSYVLVGAAVPAPGALALLGMAGIAARRRRRD